MFCVSEYSFSLKSTSMEFSVTFTIPTSSPIVLQMECTEVYAVSLLISLMRIVTDFGECRGQIGRLKLPALIIPAEMALKLDSSFYKITTNAISIFMLCTKSDDLYNSEKYLKFNNTTIQSTGYIFHGSTRDLSKRRKRFQEFGHVDR